VGVGEGGGVVRGFARNVRVEHDLDAFLSSRAESQQVLALPKYHLNKDSDRRYACVLRYGFIARHDGGAYGAYMRKHVYRRALEIVDLVLGSPRPTPASYPTIDTPTPTPGVRAAPDRTVPIPARS